METFGRYELLRKIGTGGMGTVHLARERGGDADPGRRPLVIVKRILPHLAQDEELIEMFFDEARIAARLDHPNIVRILDLGEADGTFYIAMEHVDGEALDQLEARLRQLRRPMPTGLKLRIVADAAAGLESAHGAHGRDGVPLGIIHRDVSPQNLLIGFDGSVKLIDFGVAKASNKLGHTVPGTLKGKYAYMSPEQARGATLDHRSDLFGLGIILHELLTGLRLFKRENESATLGAITSDPIPAPSSVAPSLPESLDALVLRALARDRERRFQSAGELQRALERVAEKEGLHATRADLARFMRAVYRPDDDDDDEKTEIG